MNGPQRGQEEDLRPVKEKEKDLKVSNVRECDTKIIKEFMDYGLMWGKEQGGRWSD